MINEVLYLEYMSSLIEGDKAKCAAIVVHLLEHKVDPINLYKGLFQRSLYQIGKLWESDKICVATEHVATSITECMIDLTYAALHSKEKRNKKVIVACVPKEFHQIGAKIVADLFEWNGWETFLVGANAPVSELFRLIRTKQPHLLAISLTFYINVLRLLDLIEKVKKEFPRLKIIVGGQALANGKDEVLNKFKNVFYIPSLAELELFLKNTYKTQIVKSKVKVN
ncbi:MAG: cobalamin-dependent protein [Ignavibacteriales bacterium]|nr:cobalamin-dependent protein [Ignavibacteriales bacterium]